MTTLSTFKYGVNNPPASEPIDAAYVRAHMHLDDTADDAMIDLLISAAREIIESYIGGAILLTGFFAEFDDTAEILELPMSRWIDEIFEAVRWSNTNDPEVPAESIDPDTYYVDVNGPVARLMAFNGLITPRGGLRIAGGISVNYSAGLTSLPELVPESLRRAIAITVQALYDGELASSDDLPQQARMLIRPYRLIGVG